MYLDTENKTCFIHIPKTGGSTVRIIFGFTHAIGRASTQHLSIEDSSEERRQLVRSDDYFKFTFVRSPVERFVSAFFYGRRHHPKGSLRYKSLGDYINYAKENTNQDIVLKPQTHFFINTKYDFIGFTDTLNADVESLRQTVGFPTEPFGHVGRYNTGTPKKVRENVDSFVSPDERKAIEEIYEEDCELFKRLKLERE